MPRWGMPGVAVGNIVAMVLSVAAFLAYLQWGQQRLQLDWRTPRLAWPMFRDILRVGALACLSPVQTALAALLLTGMVARLGPLALAGYGIGQRLEFLLIPMAFGVGIDRKSTRLNSSHLVISYAVFCLKKKTID